jgi:hypothetical protein
VIFSETKEVVKWFTKLCTAYETFEIALRKISIESNDERARKIARDALDILVEKK